MISTLEQDHACCGFRQRLMSLMGAALVFGGLLSGCQEKSPLTSRGAASSAHEPTSGTQQVVDHRVDEKVLEQNGLQTVWTRQVLDGPVERAWVVDDDIYTVVLPRPQQPRLQLVNYNRVDGLHRWYLDLEARLDHAPTIYRYPAGAAAKKDEVFIVQKDKVVCIERPYGQVLWEARQEFGIASGVVASETHFFVGSVNRRVYGVRKGKEFPEWFYITQGDVRTTGVVNDPYVYFTSSDGRAYRFHIEKGARYDGFDGNGRFETGAAIHGGPLVHSRWVFTGSTDFKLYCLRDSVTDFTPEWTAQLQAPIETAPMVAEFQEKRGSQALVLAISNDDRRTANRSALWAFTPTKGERRWKADQVAAVVATGKRAVYGVTDLRGGRGKQLVSIDAATGKENFAIPIDAFDLVPSTVVRPADQKKHHAIIFLVHRSGFIQAIGEKI